MNKDSLGDRMKRNYEAPYKITLPWRMPLIIRVDGKNFHTLTRGIGKPFDAALGAAMAQTAQHAAKELQTCLFSYQQSDEISFLFHNYKNFDTQPWFDNELQKIVSVAAATTSVWFSQLYNRRAIFDARAFIIPEAEVVNYFVWRQKDAERNSLSMIAQSLYSPKELHLKKKEELYELLHVKGHNWNDYPTANKRGVAIKRGEIDWEIPVFTQDRNYIEELLRVEEG